MFYQKHGKLKNVQTYKLKADKKNLQKGRVNWQEEEEGEEGERLNMDFLLQIANWKDKACWKVFLLLCRIICLQLHQATQDNVGIVSLKYKVSGIFVIIDKNFVKAWAKKKDVESLWGWHCHNEADTPHLASWTFFHISPNLLFRFLSVVNFYQNIDWMLLHIKLCQAFSS